MAEIRDLSDAYAWPISRLADCFGLHRQTLTKRIRECGVVPAGEHRGNPTYHIKDVARIIFAPVEDGFDGEASVDLDNHPELRKAWYQSENERVKFQVSVGQLIPDHQVAREMSLVVKNIASNLDSLADTLERDAGLKPKQRDLVEKVLDAAREQMYEKLMAAEVEEDESDDE